MRRQFFFSGIFLFGSLALHAQSVGLVLSGGGAKGLAHIGVLKALEENDIPIDYVVGTSMGGIVAGCYASGMSPDEIETMVLSDDFRRWVNGEPEKGFNYFYHKSPDDPHFIKINLSLDSTFNIHFNTSIASDVSLNFAFAEKMAEASAISKDNFDSLLVPFRVVASDVFTQEVQVLSNGPLSEALRVTQTVPFFYNPIRFQGKYLFDGGIYDNFPVDVVQSQFHPDVVIGSNVSSKVFDKYPYGEDDNLISHSLLYMLLDKSDPEDMPENGIYLQPDLKGYTAFDFGSAKSMIDSGYQETMRKMPEIKRQISARRSCDEMAARRNAFLNRSHPLVFDRLEFEGFNVRQQHFIEHVFRVNPAHPHPLYINDIKQGYFRLVSEDYFSNVFPDIVFDSLTRKFVFQLRKRPQQNFQIGFGGNIATRNVSTIYLGADYYRFDRTLTHAYAGFEAGSFFKSADLRARIDYPYFNQIFLQPEVIFNNWDYLESEDLLSKRSPTVLTRFDRNASVYLGKPLGNFFRAGIGVEGINNSDHFSNGAYFVSADTLDELELSGYKVGFDLLSDNLNRKQYASAGKKLHFSLGYYNLTEQYTPGSTSILTAPTRGRVNWFRLRFSAEQYFNRGWYRPGYLLECVFSNQPAFANYYATIINAPGFFPMQDSRTLLLENFRAFNYLAGGLRNVFALHSKLDLRIEGYLFKPLEYLTRGQNQDVAFNESLNTIFFAGSASLVMHSPIGPIALSFNYYDDKQNEFGVLLHVGYMLFPHHSIGN